MACKDCTDKAPAKPVINTAAVTYDLLTGELALSAEDAAYLVDLGVRATPADDALSVLGVSLVASVERARDLQATLDERTVALEEAEADLEELEKEFNLLTESVEGLHSKVEDHVQED